MKEEVKVVSPVLQCVCLGCGKTSVPFQQAGEVGIEKSAIPFGVLEKLVWQRPDGTPYEMNRINSIPSLCPACQELGITLEMFGEVGPVGWYQEKEEIIYGG